MDCSPPGSSVPGILQAGILEWVYHAFLQGTFLTWGSNLCLSASPAVQADSLPTELPGKPEKELVYV